MMFNFAQKFPLNETEDDLSRLECSWSDFAAWVRTGVGIRRSDPGRSALQARSLLTFHEVFELHRKNYEGGDASALLDAIQESCRAGLPLPYWASDAILLKLDQLAARPVSLHTLFGLDKKLPATGKKATNARRSVTLRQQIYVAVGVRLMDGAPSLERALQEAKKSGQFHCSIRQARILYDEQKSIQDQYLATYPGKVHLHRIRGVSANR